MSPDLAADLSALQLSSAELATQALVIYALNISADLLDIRLLRQVCKAVKDAADSRIESITLTQDDLEHFYLSTTMESILPSLKGLQLVFEHGMVYSTSDVYRALSQAIATYCGSLEELYFQVHQPSSSAFLGGRSLLSALSSRDWPNLRIFEFNVRLGSPEITFDFLSRMPALDMMIITGVDSLDTLHAIANALEAMQPCNLHKLDIQMNDIEMIFPYTLPQIREMMNRVVAAPADLRFLGATNAALGERLFLDLGAPELKTLESLHLTDITAPVSLAELAATPKPRLQALFVRGCRCVRDLNALTASNFPALKFLHLDGGTAPEDDDWSGLAALDLPDLNSLFLVGVRITGDDLEFLSTSLARMTNLAALKIVPQFDLTPQFNAVQGLATLFSQPFTLSKLTHLQLERMKMMNDELGLLFMKYSAWVPNVEVLEVDCGTAVSVALMTGAGLAGSFPKLQYIATCDYVGVAVGGGEPEFDEEIGDWHGMPFSAAWATGMLRQAWPEIEFEFKHLLPEEVGEADL